MNEIILSRVLTLLLLYDVRRNATRVRRSEPRTASPGAWPAIMPERYSGGMSLLDRIVVDPEVVHGRPAIRGTRVRVADVLSLLAAGASESEILQDYPYLAVEDIRASLEYAAAQANHAILIAS